MATSAALPSSVNFFTVKLRNGRIGWRVASEYTPYPAARTTAMPSRTSNPVRAFGRVSCAELCGEDAAVVVDPELGPCTIASGSEPEARVEVRLPDPTSRFRRLRSPRKSAADW